MGELLYAHEAVQIGLTAGCAFTGTAKRIALMQEPFGGHPRQFFVMADDHCYVKQGNSSVTATSSDLRLQRYQPMYVMVTSVENSFLSVLRVTDNGTLRATLLRVEPVEMSALLDGSTQYFNITDAAQTNLAITSNMSLEAAIKFTNTPSGAGNTHMGSFPNVPGDGGTDIHTVLIADATQTGLDITGDLTIELWARWDRVDGSPNTLIAKHQAAGTSRGYNLTWVDTPLLRLQISSDGTSGNQDSLSVTWLPTINTWYHIAVTWDASASTAKFYINGAQQGADQVGVQTSIHNNGVPFRIGSLGGTTGGSASQPFMGDIDDVRIWNTVRTTAQILANYQTQLAGTESNLQGYWQLNNDLTDETSNGNTLSQGGQSITFDTDVPFDVFQTFASKTTIGDNANYGWQFYFDPNGNLGFRFGQSTDSGTWKTHQTTWSPTAGIWYHIAVTVSFSGSVATTLLYASSIENGLIALLDTKTHSASNIKDVSSDFIIGGVYNGSGAIQNFDGQIKNVRIWSGNVLTLNQLNAMRLTTVRAAQAANSVVTSNFIFNGDARDTEGDHLTMNGSPVFLFDTPNFTKAGDAVL